MRQFPTVTFLNCQTWSVKVVVQFSVSVCARVCVEDKNLRSELSTAEEEDVGHKVYVFCFIVVVIVTIIMIHIVI